MVQAKLAALGPISKLVQVKYYNENKYISWKYIHLSPELQQYSFLAYQCLHGVHYSFQLSWDMSENEPSQYEVT
jgi:hypothetical protein